LETSCCYETMSKYLPTSSSCRLLIQTAFAISKPRTSTAKRTSKYERRCRLPHPSVQKKTLKRPRSSSTRNLHTRTYIYHGVLRYTDAATDESRREGVTINELLLRDCTVRNTSWIIGLVVLTGPDTKIYLNDGQTPSKQSKIAKETNFNVIVNFIFLVIICSVSATINGIMDGQTATSKASSPPVQVRSTRSSLSCMSPSTLTFMLAEFPPQLMPHRFSKHHPNLLHLH
jgi:hypothetical protein